MVFGTWRACATSLCRSRSRTGSSRSSRPGRSWSTSGPNWPTSPTRRPRSPRLDLVICVDTAIAHLAGALGKPVWLLLPEIGDFRWLEGRDDSPWYPTMRLFRQRVLGEWDEVVARVKAALQEAVRSGSVPKPAHVAISRAGIAPTLLERTLSAEPANIARVVETRYGIIQYLPDAGHSARSIAWYGELLQPQLDLLSRLIRPGAHIVEAGSGAGEHAIALAKMVGVHGLLLVYETRPVVRQLLRQNLDVNRVDGIVTLMRRDLAGPRRALPGIGEAGSVAADSSAAPNAAAVDTVDALLLDRLDLLKINSDVDALDILDGASATLWRLRPIVFISARDESALTSLIERAREFGYRCWRMETPLFPSRQLQPSRHRYLRWECGAGAAGDSRRDRGDNSARWLRGSRASGTGTVRVTRIRFGTR